MNADWKALDTLVLVAGHAVYVADDFRDPSADASWYLQGFQKGEPPFYIEHIQEGVRCAAEDERALLVFSGGQTRVEAGPRSEAHSYWMVAHHAGWWECEGVEARAITEDFARDSFENLLFSICRFRIVVGHVPERLHVISWAFKQQRFALHCDAIRYPRERFEFTGPNNPVDLAVAEKGEAEAIALFAADPYGTGDVLRRKREDRNPFMRVHPYEQTCPKLAQLLRHKGPELYIGELPW